MCELERGGDIGVIVGVIVRTVARVERAQTDAPIYYIAHYNPTAVATVIDDHPNADIGRRRQAPLPIPPLIANRPLDRTRHRVLQQFYQRVVHVRPHHRHPAHPLPFSDRRNDLYLRRHAEVGVAHGFGLDDRVVDYSEDVTVCVDGSVGFAVVESDVVIAEELDGESVVKEGVD